MFGSFVIIASIPGYFSKVVSESLLWPNLPQLSILKLDTSVVFRFVSVFTALKLFTLESVCANRKLYKVVCRINKHQNES